MAWKTVEDNAVTLGFPSGGVDVLRIVFDPQGSDIAYVVQLGPDNGNRNARLIAAAPDLWNACRLMWEAVANCGCNVPPDVLRAARHCKSVCVNSF